MTMVATFSVPNVKVDKRSYKYKLKKKVDLQDQKEVEPYSSKHVILRAGAMLIFSVSYKFERKKFNWENYHVRITTSSRYSITIKLSFKLTFQF